MIDLFLYTNFRIQRMKIKNIIFLGFLFCSGIVNGQWNNRSVTNEVPIEIINTINEFKAIAELEGYFNQAYGYAVFPNIRKAGLGLGGARGDGQVFVNEELIGDSTVTQVSLGLTIGVSSYKEIIFFREEADVQRFTQGNFELGAQASAVAITAGVGAEVEYSNGIAIFTQTNGGLMIEASIGGQKFSFNRVLEN